MSSRNFKGVWIPRKLWESNELNSTEKLFIAEIDSLTGDSGCFASNQYLADFFGMTTRGVQKIISELITKGFLTREIVTKKTGEVESRFIKLSQKSIEFYFDAPMNENTQGGEQLSMGGGEPEFTYITKNTHNKDYSLNIEARKDKFGVKVFNESNTIKFGKEMLNDFFNYWTEHSDLGKKMKFEKQDTFNVQSRLSRWAANANRFGFKNKPTGNSAMDILRKKYDGGQY